MDLRPGSGPESGPIDGALRLRRAVVEEVWSELAIWVDSIRLGVQNTEKIEKFFCF
jgi:hypothetical protein